MLIFSRFAVVGGVGFVVDASIFYILITSLILPYPVARSASFLCAMLCTWLGNRYFTFTDASRANSKHQLAKHCCCASFSFLFNYSIFQILLFAESPLSVAFIAGILVGMVCNYYVSKKVVFV
ncbi:GtrA family protein [Thalassotalea atypica]|uniref:GtrA family protein n=1 Tax=Thalassotalea atypica TaxID=2054316 RepID=UPI002572C5D7|nr:GtrA family protein [Thalassotalea atypica]